MKNPFIFLIAFLTLSWTASAQQYQLSENATVSVITCGPYQHELYSAFGHSAFRVHDPATGFDAAYNYGVFDFNQPNFYLNFARGFLYYKLGVYDYKRFEGHYIYDNRFVHEQVLDLTQAQKQKMFDFLQNNAQPENANYRYDYFYNNCATKLRDVVKEVFGDSVRFDGSYIKGDESFRSMTDKYLTEQPWGDLGIDICLGLPMDKTMTPSEYMFLPDYVESAFDRAYIKKGNQEIPIVARKNMIYESRPEEDMSGPPHPLVLFIPLALLALGLVWYDIKRNALSIWFDTILFGVTGLIGVLLFFLWFMTDHQAAARNLNILWAMPLHLAAAIAFFTRASWLKKYFLFVLILSGLLILLWPVFPQQLNTALIPIVVAQLGRAYAQYRLR